MANYCSNWFWFSGKKEDLQKLHDSLRYAESLNPENYGLIWYETFYAALGLDVPSEPTDVYDMFGSKWLDIQEMQLSDTELWILGNSAWEPVVPFVALLCEKFNLNAKGEYEEAGCDFGGFFSVVDGKLIDDRCNYICYRYLSEGLEGILSELDFYDNLDEKIELLNSTKGYISGGHYDEVLNEIRKSLHKPIN
jgi:hypothetical protein